jgi:ribonucleotide reductase alpha subunit
MTNLCTEITLPTTPVTKDPSEGRIALCSLSAINWGKFGTLSKEKEQKDFALTCEMAVRGLDALLSYQEYPRLEAELSTQEYRPLGIGMIGFAHWLAKNEFRWGEEHTLDQTNRMMENMAYHLTSASIKLAEEFGSCGKRTKYHDGWMPMDDASLKMPHYLDWDPLRERAKKYGIRNATLMAFMPSECQAWSNKLNLADGTTPNFHELLENFGIDYAQIEASEMPTRIAVPHFKIKTQFGDKPVDSVYYNGLKPTYSVTFDDGNTYDFTGNHLIQVNRNGATQWSRVDELMEGDDVICKEQKIKVVSTKVRGFQHTWDVSVPGVEEYLLPNGVVSHNTSSQLANETNAFEPPKDLITIKGSKEGSLPQVVPEFLKFGHNYETVWNVSAEKYISTVAVFQRYCDQAMSTNTSYDPSQFAGQLPLSRLAIDLISGYKKGIKTFYYNNTRDSSGAMDADDCESGACKI